MTIEPLDALAGHVRERFGDHLSGLRLARGELTVDVRREHLRAVCLALRDDPDFAFTQLIDLCAVDYLDYRREAATCAPGLMPGLGRFAVVYHLLSVGHNRRVRVRVPAEGEPPQVDTVTDIWASANWYEREAYDLFGVVFEGHPDLRRILLDYGFIGYPLRKDFPLSGHVEMRYDPDRRRVIYQPVTVEPRINAPRVIREEGYGG